MGWNKNKRLTSPARILKLNDKVAMALLNAVPNDSYISPDSYVSIFMTFICTSVQFVAANDISFLKTLLHTYLYLDRYYTDYYNERKKGENFVHFVEDHTKTKLLTVYLSNGIRRELMCYTVS